MSGAESGTDAAVDDLVARAEEALPAGEAVIAKSLAEEALELVVEAQAWPRVAETAGLLGHASALVGEVQRAETAYLMAAECRRGLAGTDVHLDGRPGARWGWYLRTTSRWDDAREVLERSAAGCTERGDTVDAALAQVELAALELAKRLAGATLLRLDRALPVLDTEGQLPDAVRARLLRAEALLARGRHDEAGETVEAVLDACGTHGLLALRGDALVVRSRLILETGGTSTEAAVDARAALDLARDRGLVWLEVAALWAMAATEDVGRGLFDEDPPPAGLPPRAGSFADQAGRLRQRLDNQWFDLHPLRTVEQRVGR
ncbi:MAG: hypothetical protein HY830_25045 [Actinobacteria bacterium]|nr:hypothetical protein [Actinomycetota bacterium]